MVFIRLHLGLWRKDRRRGRVPPEKLMTFRAGSNPAIPTKKAALHITDTSAFNRAVTGSSPVLRVAPWIAQSVEHLMFWYRFYLLFNLIISGIVDGGYFGR